VSALKNSKPTKQLRSVSDIRQFLHRNETPSTSSAPRTSTIDDRHYEVGITFFLYDHLEEELEDIWRMEIEPYLEEYFFDRQAVVEEYRWERINGILNP
jgi:hypothetical protein